MGIPVSVVVSGAERIGESCVAVAAERGIATSTVRVRGAASVRRLLPAQLLIAARSNQPRARALLVESFLPLIAAVARSYRRVPGVDRAELVQEGVVGMLRALERYDPQLGTPFWAYASWWVREAMQQLVSELSRPVVLSDRALRQLARARSAQRDFVRANGREPSTPELACATGLAVRQLQRLLAVERRPRALEQTIEDGRTRSAATVGELVADPRAEDAFDELATRLTATQVPRLLERLSEREQSVIKARYGLAGRARSLRELGETMGVSAERVRQIEQSALSAMRAECVDSAPATAEGERSPRRSNRSRSRRIGPRSARPAARPHAVATA